jgi:hypothetical protein
VPRERSGRTVAPRGDGCSAYGEPRHADPPLSFASSAREDVVEGAAENDGVKLVIADCHLGGKTLFTSNDGCSSRGRGPPATATLVRTGRRARDFDCTQPWFAGRLGERFGYGRDTDMPL